MNLTEFEERYGHLADIPLAHFAVDVLGISANAAQLKRYRGTLPVPAHREGESGPFLVSAEDAVAFIAAKDAKPTVTRVIDTHGLRATTAA